MIKCINPFLTPVLSALALHVPPAQTFIPFYPQQNVLSINEPPLFHQRLLNSSFKMSLSTLTPPEPQIIPAWPWPCPDAFGTSPSLPGQLCSPQQPWPHSCTSPCSPRPQFAFYWAFNAAELWITGISPNLYNPFFYCCLVWVFFPFNCMIIYIPLLFSVYSFTALCFPTTPKPKVVLTPGLEQILFFKKNSLIINNLYTKPEVCIFHILLQTSHSFL